jgi:hypothetical protein
VDRRIVGNCQISDGLFMIEVDDVGSAIELGNLVGSELEQLGWLAQRIAMAPKVKQERELFIARQDLGGEIVNFQLLHCYRVTWLDKRAEYCHERRAVWPWHRGVVLARQQYPQSGRKWSNRYPYDHTSCYALRCPSLALLAYSGPEATACLLAGAIGTMARYDDSAMRIEEFNGEVVEAQGPGQLCQLLDIEYVMQWQTLKIHCFPFASYCFVPDGVGPDEFLDQA